MIRRALVLVLLCLGSTLPALPAEEPALVLPLWPEKPPGDTAELPPEADTTKPTDQLIAGRRVARIGNVSTPTLALYRPAAEQDTGTAVLICPGGGHHILAYDLEGTEVAEWLNSLGITGVVLKYRVPARDPDRRWRAAVQDAQRAMSLVRGHADPWGIDRARIGILGFSAGGETAALTALFGDQRQYEPIDETDRVSPRPDFAVLVYPGALVEKNNLALRPHVAVREGAPPMFFAHAQDDPVHPSNSLLLALALKQAGVPAEVHLYARGGHGFGLRPTEAPCTHWPQRCAEWMRSEGWLADGKH
jgi:acetyl esterase/lipase